MLFSQIFSTLKLSFWIIKFKLFNNNLSYRDLFIIKKNILNSGAVSIKFTQWLIPFLYLTIDDKYKYIPEYFESLYDDCNYDSINHIESLYYQNFNQKFKGDYILLNKIGSGSIAQTYTIKSIHNDNIYIMKIKHPNINYMIYFIYYLNIIINFMNINILPINGKELLLEFLKQLDFRIESYNILYFYNLYINNKLINIPKLIEYSYDIIIMSYEPGKNNLSSIDNYKKYNLLSLFMITNELYHHYSHGDLHQGNYSYNNKLNIYDFGYCWINNNQELKDLSDNMAYNHNSKDILLNGISNYINLLSEKKYQKNNIISYIKKNYPKLLNKINPPNNQNYYDNVDLIIKFPVKNLVFNKMIQSFYSEITFDVLVNDKEEKIIFSESWNEVIKKTYYEETKTGELIITKSIIIINCS